MEYQLTAQVNGETITLSVIAEYEEADYDTNIPPSYAVSEVYIPMTADVCEGLLAEEMTLVLQRPVRIGLCMDNISATRGLINLETITGSHDLEELCLAISDALLSEGQSDPGERDDKDWLSRAFALGLEQVKRAVGE